MYEKIEQPSTCPSCDSLLEQVKDQLFCTNLSCPAQNQKAVEHFAKTLKIKGLGPASIKKLGLVNIPEIYELEQEGMKEILGEKITIKLLQEIERSKTVDLETLLPAFGISLIGKSAANKLCSHISHISELSKETCQKAGIGPKATENLLNWYSNEFFKIADIGFSFKSPKKQEKVLGTVCITGKLKTYKTKAEAEKHLSSFGYLVKPSLTKDVTILINESGLSSTKTKKAQQMGIPIITNILELTGN